MSSVKKQLDNPPNQCYNSYVVVEINYSLLKSNIKHLVFKLFSIINLYSLNKVIDGIITMAFPN